MSTHVLDSTQERSRPHWSSIITSEMELVEQDLKTAFASDVSVAYDLAIHLFSAGGKRIRPALVLLSALATGNGVNVDRAVRIAVATELVHTASLVHDDVVDETHERRGVETANAHWGNKLSVLGGDFLLSKAFTILSLDGDPEVMRLFAGTAVRMTESEMLQAESEGSLSLWQKNYWPVITGKTASFMGSCCECGAIVSGVDADLQRAMTEYGTQVGLAFQITDDVLDIEGDPALTGKDAGSDLMHGKFTLPVLLALDSVNRDALQSIIESSQDCVLSREHAREVAKLVVSCGAADKAKKVAQEHAESACKQLRALAPSDYADALETLALSIVTRRG